MDSERFILSDNLSDALTYVGETSFKGTIHIGGKDVEITAEVGEVIDIEQLIKDSEHDPS